MVVEGARYEELSERNRLGSSLVFAERGIIYDRNGVTMAWNIPRIRDGQYEIFDERAYASTTGSGHVLGYVRMPARDTRGVFYRTGIEGVSGAELVYDDTLRGVNGE
jgi:cell division protein FtsI/penicillin-binding protein 2